MTDYETLKENREFHRAYSRGKHYVSPTLVSYAVKNRRHVVRVGITTGKKTGNAVRRNRSRRVIREAFRSLSPRVGLARWPFPSSRVTTLFSSRGREPPLRKAETSAA